MKRFFVQSVQETLETLGTTAKGLDTERVKEQRALYGRNELQEKRKKSVWQVFFAQFLDLLVLILVAAALISLITGNYESVAVILVVIILNAVLGTVQHFKAEKSLQSLRALSSPVARVIRGGQRMEIAACDIVVGDVLALEAGDMIPADGRVIENYALQVNESALTGESTAVHKTSDVLEKDELALGDRINMVFSGSMVTYGRALVAVTEVGMQTEIGKIAALMNDTKERKTPLQISLDSFSKKLSIIIMVICFVVFGLTLYHALFGSGSELFPAIMDSLMFAVALAVAAIPEALSSIVTIALAIGTGRMAKQHAIMKNLRAVEGLGCVSIICSDKTGTLTQNKMTVTDSFCFGEGSCSRLFLSAVLCNDTTVTQGDMLGDPTETALVQAYRNANDDYFEVLEQYPRIAELPFDSERKLMSTLHRIDDKLYLMTKGAVDVLLERTTHILDNGKPREMTDADRERIERENRSMSESGLRVLAFAQKEQSEEAVALQSECDYTFLGLICMIDPPREESAPAVADCLRAGIKPIMITGDHKVTASAIARQIGILKQDDLVMVGTELDKISDEELAELLPKISVYARVSPEHKIRIVDLWQQKGEIVAMTGDGVNDAPALKKADIGIAMGITGTEVSKDAASMILTDDNFATIIKAVTNGRNIYNNIKNAILFLLSGNTAGILAVLFTSVFGLPVPFTAVHLLFINLLTDSLPALAINMERSHKDLLSEKPRSSKESILTKAFLIATGYQGVFMAAATIGAFFIGLQTDAAMASTMAFATLCLARLFHGFNTRGKNSIFKLGIHTNWYSVGAFIIGTGLLCGALFIPGVQSVFDVAPLNGMQIGVIAGLAFAPTVVIQLIKAIADIAFTRKCKKT
mgnify:CR=1 FL=1